MLRPENLVCTLLDMLGDEIRRRREEKGWTQEQLAAKVGVTYGAVQQWEKNKTAPKRSRLARVCKVLGIAPELAYGVTTTASGLAARIERLSEEDRAYLQRIIDALAGNEPGRK